MNLYEIERINAELASLIDSDTGEIADFEQFAALKMEQSELVEALVMAHIDTESDVEKLKREISRLKERLERTQARSDKLKNYLYRATGGQKYRSATASFYFRTTASVDVDEEFCEWAKQECPELLREKVTYEPNKTIIAEQLANGIPIPHAEIIVKNSMIATK